MIKHKNVYTKLLVFISVFLFLNSCIEDKAYNERKNEILKANLKALNKETQIILNSMEVKQQVSLQLQPYNKLAKRLAGLLANYIDTNLNGNYRDTIKLKQKLAELKTKYIYVLDSTRRATQHPLFLPDDYTFLKSIKFDLLPISKTDFTLNYYLSMQNILLSHQAQLRLLYNTTGYGCGWFRLYDYGYMISVYEDTKSTQLKIYYNSPKKIAKYHMLEGLKILDSNGQPIAVKNKIQNDTCYFTSSKLPKGNYTALIKFDVTDMGGYKKIDELQFPFSTW
ncbi:MAG TPA: hypothetical protein VN698_16015 [Bacteroidia bacterium]|nr:hypothetical protein [Bacteroidia bacterium]